MIALSVVLAALSDMQHALLGLTAEVAGILKRWCVPCSARSNKGRPECLWWDMVGSPARGVGQE